MPLSAVINVAPDSNEFTVNGARYLPVRDIARAHGYARDYVARLCRRGKVRGRLFAGIWYVDAESFADFIRRKNSTAQEAALPMV